MITIEYLVVLIIISISINIIYIMNNYKFDNYKRNLTVNLRGYMRVNCRDRSCDVRKNAMTSDNLEQYRLVVQTLVKVTANYYGCKG